MCAFVETICATSHSQSDKKNLFQKHFLWEKREHLLALKRGKHTPSSLVHFWKRRHRSREPAARSQSDWTLDNLLISGYDVFQMLKKKPFYKTVKSLLNVCDRIALDLGPDTTLDICLWAAYQKIPIEVRLEFNAAAYQLTAERCRIVKDVELDPPKRVKDPILLAALSAFPAPDTAQLIIDFAVDPYLPNHLRCCASTPQNCRCSFPRFKRYCPLPINCCNGFQIEPNTCLYDVCDFHILKINHNKRCVLVSCD